MTSFSEIHTHLQRRQREAPAVSFYTEAGWSLFAGLETRTCDSEYFWPGLKRGGDAAHPHLIFQFTLAGRGAFEQGDETFFLEAGQAFAAIVPSNHAYFLPRGSESWSFFWLTTFHPYIVSRLVPLIESVGPVWTIEATSPFLARSLNLWEEQHQELAPNPLSREQSLFEWMFEAERFATHLLYPQAERERWLEEVRQMVKQHLPASLEVESLARARGWSRSHFSHRFKAATGISPATWVLQVRLEEIARRLAQSDDKLEKIASDCGLGDANQLCKVFRRHFHLSPGQFRRQMR